MFRLLVYQAYHQAFLNDYYTGLGIVGGRMPVVLTSNMVYLIYLIFHIHYYWFDSLKQKCGSHFFSDLFAYCVQWFSSMVLWSL